MTFPGVTDARAFRYASITNEERDIFEKISQLFGPSLHPKKSTLLLLLQNTHTNKLVSEVCELSKEGARE